MKTICSIILIAALLLPVTGRGQLLIGTIITAAAKKVIKQIDLKVQKIQNKTLALQNAQKALENAMVKTKLAELSGWMDKQRKLYQDYYTELNMVRSEIKTFHAVRTIFAQQAKIAAGCTAAVATLCDEGVFSVQEIIWMQRVYSEILRKSRNNMDQLNLAIIPFKTQMTDGQRLELINTISRRMQTNLNDLQRFNSENQVLLLRRKKARADIERMKFILLTPKNKKP